MYAKYEFADFFSASIRAEYFDDKNGVRTGIAQKLKEITLSPEFKIAKNLLVRPEKSQDTIALGVMYTW